jgi:hypothetical protein
MSKHNTNPYLQRVAHVDLARLHDRIRSQSTLVPCETVPVPTADMELTPVDGFPEYFGRISKDIEEALNFEALPATEPAAPAEALFGQPLDDMSEMDTMEFTPLIELTDLIGLLDNLTEN